MPQIDRRNGRVGEVALYAELPFGMDPAKPISSKVGGLRLRLVL